jgi:hypothetical protein
MLTSTKITELSSTPKVKKIAVQNFLETLKDLSFQEALDNLEIDVKLYNWNTETVRVIKKGIYINFDKKTPCDNPKCGTSTGICGSLTCGSGKLDDFGYWEFPCYPCARELEKNLPEEGPVWPFKKKKGHKNENL